MARSKPASKSAPASAPPPVDPGREAHTPPPREEPPLPRRRFQISLRDNPAMVIEAMSEQEARAAYLKACGIISTDNPFSCDMLS